MAKDIFVGTYDDPNRGTTLYTKSLSDDIEHTIHLLYNHLSDIGILDQLRMTDNLGDQINIMSDQVNARIINISPDQLQDLFNYVNSSYFHE